MTPGVYKKPQPSETRSVLCLDGEIELKTPHSFLQPFLIPSVPEQFGIQQVPTRKAQYFQLLSVGKAGGIS